jgi:hypothetical protein
MIAHIVEREQLMPDRRHLCVLFINDLVGQKMTGLRSLKAPSTERVRGWPRQISDCLSSEKAIVMIYHNQIPIY